MPSPTETLLRTQDSPVPTQTIFALVGSMVTAPIDCTSCLSNTGLKVVPPFTDFQTPPLAAPIKTSSRPSSSTAEMRPLITAEPIFLARKPEMVPESNFRGVCAAAIKVHSSARTDQQEAACSLLLLNEIAIIYEFLS